MMKRLPIPWIFWLLLTLLAGIPGCAKKQVGSHEPHYMPTQEVARSGAVMDTAAEDRVPAVEAPVADPAQPKRLMIYNAELSLVVDNIVAALGQVKTIAEAVGGYMQSMDGHTITVRIPVSQFSEVIDLVEAIGEVIRKEIRGNDVTEEMQDLIIRLNNAEALRERLVALLKRADQVEDLIKIEKELARVTETIERLQGKIRYLNNQIAFSTLTVHFNSPLPQQTLKKTIPFPWVRQLGSEMVAPFQSSYHGRTDGRGVKFDLPPTFAKYYQDGYLTRATSAEGLLVKVERHANIEKTTLEFWQALIKRALLEEQNILITHTDALSIRKKKKMQLIFGSKTIGGEPHAYLVAVGVSQKYVTTFEAWGETKLMKENEAVIIEAIQSVRLP